MQFGNGRGRIFGVIREAIYSNQTELAFALILLSQMLATGLLLGGWFLALDGGALIAGLLLGLAKDRPRKTHHRENGNKAGKIIKCLMIPNDLYEAIKEQATWRGISVQELLVEVIRDSVSLHLLLKPADLQSADGGAAKKH